MFVNEKFGYCIALILPAVAILCAIWFPFGFSLIGLIEEWDVLGLFSQHGVFYIVDKGTPLSAHLLRPLTIFPQAVGYTFDQNSYNYWHVILLIFLAGKTSAASHLVWKATGSLFYGMLVGGLVLLYPADTMQLSFRAIHINVSLSLLLIGCSLFIFGYENNSQVVSRVSCALAGLFLFISVCMYEAALVLSILPMLILFVKYGFKLTLRNALYRKFIIFLWLAGLIAYLGYAIIVFSNISSYQSSVVGGVGIFTILLGSMSKLISIALLRGLFGGWYDAFRILCFEYVQYYYVFFMSIAISLSVVVVSLYAIRNNIKVLPYLENWVAARLLFVGLLLVFLGYFPFLLSPSHQVISQRTFLWIAPGAAMFWVAIIIFVSNRSQILAALLSFALILLGLSAQVFQMQHYVKISDSQRMSLRSIVENFDGKLLGKTLVIVDGRNLLGHTWMFLPGTLPFALSYIYGIPVNSIEICHLDGMEWQRADGLGRKGKCAEDENGWMFSYSTDVEGPGYTSPVAVKPIQLPKSKVFVLKIDADGQVLPDSLLDMHRKELIGGMGGVSRRYNEILNMKSQPFATEMFVNPDNADVYRWSFGDWWSMELPIPGSGWREAEWDVRGLRQDSVAWKVQDEATLNFRFSPSSRDYVFKARFPLFVNDEIKNSMRILLNDEYLEYKFVSNELVEAKVKRGALRSGSNKLTINSISESKYYGLSLKMDWFELSPK
jgi:hypothetical protein